MVDIETGKAIYKRQLDWARMPSEPAAVDTDSDGYLDRIYTGTTAGRIYRIDLTADILNDPSDPDDDRYPALDGLRGAAQRRRAAHRAADPADLLACRTRSSTPAPRLGLVPVPVRRPADLLPPLGRLRRQARRST